MHVAILRREPQASVSMDVYADGLIKGLKVVRPTWKITELYPSLSLKNKYFQWFNGISKYYERYWRYPTRLKYIGADIFHVIDHSDGHLSSWLQRFQLPNVVTCHDLINLVKPETFKGRARFPLISMAAWRWGIEGMHQANQIISVSSHTKQDAVKHLGISPQNITVIGNAVSNVFQRLPLDEIQDLRHQYGLKADTFCLLNVGSNNARKNVSTILVIVEKLKAKGIPINFFKVGVDFNEEQKQFIQFHDLADSITYLGQPNEAGLIQIYNVANCLIAPSLYEGFGLTILEAMACGTPVITANITAMPEVAGDAAILIDPLNVNAIVNAILRLYREPQYRQTLAHKGLERVRHFTWENTAEQVARVYEQVLA